MSKTWRQVLVLIWTFTLCFTGLLFSQSTVSTGSIQGTVTDSSGAAVPNAKVTLTNTGTSEGKTVTTNASGFYNSGSIIPGNYKIRVEAAGFQSLETTVVAQIGNTTGYNAKLQVGSQSQTIDVEASSVGVNTEQSSVQGVLTAQQIDQLAGQWPQLPRSRPARARRADSGRHQLRSDQGWLSVDLHSAAALAAPLASRWTASTSRTKPSERRPANIPSERHPGIPDRAIDDGPFERSEFLGRGERHHSLGHELDSRTKVSVTSATAAEGARLPHPPGLDARINAVSLADVSAAPSLKTSCSSLPTANDTTQHSFIPVTMMLRSPAFSGGFESPFKESDVIGRVDYKGPHRA